MMGPGFGRALGRSMVFGLIFVIGISILFGIALDHSIHYLVYHIHFVWK
jgi:hypothetical protein